MRHIIYEFWKNVQNKFGILCLICLLLLNGFLLWIDAIPKGTDFTPKMYQSLLGDIEDYSLEEKKVYISEQISILQMMTLFPIWEREGDGEQQFGDYKEVIPNISYEDLREKYYTGEYLKYSNHVLTELSLYRTVYQEISQCEAYTENIDQLLETIKESLKSTKQYTYQYRRLAEYYISYSNVRYVKTEYVGGYGIRCFFQSHFTDLLVIIFLMISATIVVGNDLEDETTIFSATLFNGRIPLGLAKYFSLLGISCFSVAFYLENLLFMICHYGARGFGISIQSFMGFELCTLPVNLLQMILIYILLKLLGMLAISTLFYVICNFIGKRVISYAVMGLFFVCNWIGKMKISNVSWISWLRYVMPFGWIDTNEFLCKYGTINVFGYAVDQSVAVMTLCIAVIIIGALFGVAFFLKNIYKDMYNYEIRQLYPSFFWSHTGLVRHELYKSAISRKGCFVIGALICGYVLFFPHIQSVHNTSYEQEAYAMLGSVEGPVNSVDEKYWNGISEHYQELKINAVAEGNFSKINKIQDVLSAVDLCMERDKKLREKRGSWFLDDRGYEIIFNPNGLYDRDEKVLLLIMYIILVVMFGSLFSMEYDKYGAYNLIGTTSKGKSILSIIKCGIAGFYSLLIYAIVWIPQYIDISRRYSLSGWNAPAYSLSYLEFMPAWVTVGESFVALNLYRFMMIWILYFGMHRLIRWLKMPIFAIIVVSVIICVIFLVN